MSGFRDAEGRFTTWRDVDFRHTAVRVTAKPHWGFRPKNWEEREVPVPQRLITLLQKYRPTGASPDDPVFPSTTGNPDSAMLEKLKAVAWRGKLNCYDCVVKHELSDGKIKTNRCASGPTAAGISCTSSAIPMPRDTCKTALTSAPCRGGWGIVTSPRP
jgi:hypothetical protein